VDTFFACCGFLLVDLLISIRLKMSFIDWFIKPGSCGSGLRKEYVLPDSAGPNCNMQAFLPKKRLEMQSLICSV